MEETHTNMNVFSTVLSFLKKSWRPSPSSRYWDTVISAQHKKKTKNLLSYNTDVPTYNYNMASNLL